MKSHIAALAIAIAGITSAAAINTPTVTASDTTSVAPAFSTYGGWAVVKRDTERGPECTVLSTQRYKPMFGLRPEKSGGFSVSMTTPEDVFVKANINYGIEIKAGTVTIQDTVQEAPYHEGLMLGVLEAKEAGKLGAGVVEGPELWIFFGKRNWLYTTNGLPDALRVATRC